MIGKRGLPPPAVGKVVGIGGISPQHRQDLSTYPLDRIGIKTRTRERQTQQVECLVAMLIQCSERPMDVIASNLETEFDCLLLQALVICRAVEVARTLIEKVGGEICSSALVGVVLTGTAMKGVIERDEGNRLFLYEPGFDAGGADDFFNRHCRTGYDTGRQRRGDTDDGCNEPDHDRFSACGLVSLIK